MKSVKIVSVVILVFFSFYSCEKEESEMAPPFMDSYADVEQCLSFFPLKVSQPDPGQSCIYYEYDGDSVLNIIHYNAAFNCCPKEIITSFEIRHDTIFIKEDHAEDFCRCNCLYNVEFTIHNLPVGEYVLSFNEPLLPPEEEKLTMKINLEELLSDQVCLDRNFYPWSDQ